MVVCRAWQKCNKEQKLLHTKIKLSGVVASFYMRERETEKNCAAEEKSFVVDENAMLLYIYGERND